MTAAGQTSRQVRPCSEGWLQEVKIRIMKECPGTRRSEKQVAASYARIPGWKRPVDIAFVVLTLPVWLPLMLLISVGIKLVSPGPIFFRQTRIGYKGEPFTCFKFRSMQAGAEVSIHRDHLDRLIKENLPMTKIDDNGDPRVVRLGPLLRASGLDELPQFINVLKGEMSVVGPRPATIYEFQRYQPRHRNRLGALPGLTGLWQVSGKNSTTFEEMVRLDTSYARQCSLWLDLKIMARTFPLLLRQTREFLRKRKRKSVSQSQQTAAVAVETNRSN